MSKRLVQTKLNISQSGLNLRTSPRKRPYHLQKSHSDGSKKQRRGFNMSHNRPSYAQTASHGGGLSRNFPSHSGGGRGNRNNKDRGLTVGHSTDYRRSNSYGSPGSSSHQNFDNNFNPRSSPGSEAGSSSYFSKRSAKSEEDEYKCIDLRVLRRAPDCYKSKLGALRHAADHTVLFKVPPQGWSSNSVLAPYPNSFEDKWDDNHVYMPCSPHNSIPSLHGTPSRRWEMIEDVLTQPISGIWELEEAILSYNQHYANRWSFEALAEFLRQDKRKMDEFFTHTLPFIQNLALQLPSLVTQPIPILKQGRPSKLTMSQHQAACLLANAFFCTFPKRNARMKYAIIPDINFSNLYRSGSGGDSSRKIEKLKCIINYFERVKEKMPNGTITFARHKLPESLAPRWDSYVTKLTDLYVSTEGNIEDDGDGMLQADFANKYVGGGVLGNGLVQEEIRFIICPEMIVSRLFTQVLQDNEVLIMTGCERFSNYRGYANTFQYAGNYEDPTGRDDWGRMYTEVVAMDALSFYQPDTQYEEHKILRELNKAYCAFQGIEFTSNLPAVCTGNWGCGAFKGDKHLKALIQLMAASVAGRQVCYFTFDDETLRTQLLRVHGMLSKQSISIKELYKLILDYSRKVIKNRHKFWESHQTLFQFIANAMGESLEGAAETLSRYSANDFGSLDSMEDTSNMDSQDYKAGTP